MFIFHQLFSVNNIDFQSLKHRKYSDNSKAKEFRRNQDLSLKNSNQQQL